MSHEYISFEWNPEKPTPPEHQAVIDAVKDMADATNRFWAPCTAEQYYAPWDHTRVLALDEYFSETFSAGMRFKTELLKLHPEALKDNLLGEQGNKAHNTWDIVRTIYGLINFALSKKDPEDKLTVHDVLFASSTLNNAAENDSMHEILVNGRVYRAFYNSIMDHCSTPEQRVFIWFLMMDLVKVELETTHDAIVRLNAHLEWFFHTFSYSVSSAGMSQITHDFLKDPEVKHSPMLAIQRYAWQHHHETLWYDHYLDIVKYGRTKDEDKRRRLDELAKAFSHSDRDVQLEAVSVYLKDLKDAHADDDDPISQFVFKERERLEKEDPKEAKEAVSHVNAELVDSIHKLMTSPSAQCLGTLWLDLPHTELAPVALATAMRDFSMSRIKEFALGAMGALFSALFNRQKGGGTPQEPKAPSDDD